MSKEWENDWKNIKDKTSHKKLLTEDEKLQNAINMTLEMYPKEDRAIVLDKLLKVVKKDSK